MRIELLSIALTLCLVAIGVSHADEPVRGPADLAREFVSPFDGSRQPYRLYLPSAYDGSQPFPLLVALHGTGGDQNKYFDHEAYHHGIYKTEAEKQGIAVLCLHGGDAEGRPTEWRGVGELHVLAAIEEVSQNFNIDRDRIVCTGQSMGGTGTTYLCCRYPDLFAAGIPLASTYGHVSLVKNLRHVPMFYVHGAEDWPIYAKTGPIPLTEEMRRLGYNGTLWMIPGAGHNTMDVSTERVIAWALEQRRNASPAHITHRAYFPQHGRAWWLEIQGIERPGWFAEVDARVAEGNRIDLAIANTSQLVLRPDEQLFNLAEPITVAVDGNEIFHERCGSQQEISLVRNNDTWTATIQPLRIRPRTEWQEFVVATVDVPPTWEGEAETTLGNWLTDSMRAITGADIAICTKGHYRYGNQYRGAQVEAGQEVRFIELINWLRPSDAALATFKLRGSDLLAILELNLSDKPGDERFLVQVSGCRYTFDRRRPFGQRIVETDIEPDREYTIVCNSSDITRDDTLHLGPYFERLGHTILEPTRLSAAWYYIQQHGGRIHARLEGRVMEVRE